MATETVSVRLDETWKLLSADNAAAMSWEVVSFGDALFSIGDAAPSAGSFTGLRQRTIPPTVFGTAKVYARAVRDTARVNITRTVNAGNAGTPVFQAVGLSAATALVTAQPGAAIGTLQNRLAGATTRIVANGSRFALSADGNTLLVGLRQSEPGKQTVTIRESHPDAGDSDTTIEVTFTAPALAITGVPIAPVDGQDLQWRPTVSGGYGQRSFRLGGSLPTGWSMSSTSGAIYAPADFLRAALPSAADVTLVVSDESGTASVTVPISVSGLVPIIAPASLNMTLVSRDRPVQPHPEGDFQIDFLANFTDASQAGLFSAASGGFSIASGFMTLTSGGGANNIIQLVGTSVVPFEMLSMPVVFSGDGSASDQLRMGAWKDADNHAMAVFNKQANQVAWDVRLGATQYATATYAEDLSAYTDLGASLTGSQLTAWGFNGATKVALATVDLNAQFKFTGDLTGWRWTAYGRSDGATRQKLGRWKITPFGGIGLRDIKAAKYEDGAPLIVDGEIIQTATVAAINDVTGRGLYLGIFRFNPTTYKRTQVGRFLFSETVGGVANLFGGASGCLVRNRRTGKDVLLVSTYGASAVGVGLKEMDIGPLTGTILVSDLSMIDPSRNDADLVFDGSQYVLAYCRTSTTPAIRRAATIAGLLTAAPVDLGPTTTEGVIIRKIGGVQYLMTQDYTSHKWRAWRLSDLVEVGNVNVSLIADMYSAHPNIFPVPVSGGTKYVCLSFSNSPYPTKLNGTPTYGNGDVLVWESQVVSGNEFPLPAPIVIPAALRAALDRVKNRTGRATVLCVGDSNTACISAAGGLAGSYPVALAKRLRQIGIPALSESVCGNALQAASYNSYNPKVDIGTWSYDGAKPTAGGNMFRIDTSGPVWTFTPGTAVDTFEILTVQVPSGGGTAALAIGGAAPASGPASIAATGASLALVKTVVKAATPSRAALTLTKSVAGSFLLVSVRAYNAADPAVDVINAGWPGSTSANWNDTAQAYSAINVIKAQAPDLVLIALGTNDWNGGVAPATFTANITALIDAAASVGSAVGLMSTVMSDSATSGNATEAVQQAIVDATIALATARGVPYFGLFKRNGSYAEANAKGMMADNKHLSGLGQDDAAKLIADAIFLR